MEIIQVIKDYLERIDMCSGRGIVIWKMSMSMNINIRKLLKQKRIKVIIRDLVDTESLLLWRKYGIKTNMPVWQYH